MKRRKLLTVLFAVVFVSCLGMFVRQLVQYQMGAQVYQQAEEMAGASDLPSPNSPPASEPSPIPENRPMYPPAIQALLDIDLSPLQEVNPDVLGWITIPDTKLSYPMVQGDDNSYYLNRTWDKTSNSAGSVFLDWHVQPDFSDFNTVIYGHRMRNNSMFGSLKYYRGADYWADHPDVYISNADGVARYRIFAAYEVSVLGDTYRMSFPDNESRQNFLDFCTEQSVLKTDLTPTIDDQIITLSTCTGTGYAKRWVVQAALAETYPAL